MWRISGFLCLLPSLAEPWGRTAAQHPHPRTGPAVLARPAAPGPPTRLPGFLLRYWAGDGLQTAYRSFRIHRLSFSVKKRKYNNVK